jgi:hypothetical protein
MLQNMSVYNGSILSMRRRQPKTFDRRTHRASASAGMPKGMLVRQTKSNWLQIIVWSRTGYTRRICGETG